MLEQHARARAHRHDRSVERRCWLADVNACAYDTLDSFDRPFEFPRDRSDELGSFGRLARHETSFPDSIEDPGSEGTRKPFVGQRRKGARNIVAGDAHSEASIRSGVHLFGCIHADAIERKDHTVGGGIVETTGEWHRARTREQNGPGGKASKDVFAAHDRPSLFGRELVLSVYCGCGGEATMLRTKSSRVLGFGAHAPRRARAAFRGLG